MEGAVSTVAGLVAAALTSKMLPPLLDPQAGSSEMTLPPAATLPLPPLPPTPAICVDD